MLRTKNFGRKSLNEIKELLTTMGLGLGMKVDSVMKEVQEAQTNTEGNQPFIDRSQKGEHQT